MLDPEKVTYASYASLHLLVLTPHRVATRIKGVREGGEPGTTAQALCGLPTVTAFAVGGIFILIISKRTNTLYAS